MEDIEYKGEVRITERKLFVMNFVEDIEAFDEGYVSLNTKMGKVTVEGRELKILSLEGEDGEIRISGEISGVLFSGGKQSGGFLSKFFK